MTRVLIAFASDMGHTRRLAEALAEGARSADEADVTLRELPSEGPMGVTVAEVLAADALVLGSPVHHRSMHYRMKQFIEDVVYPPYIDDRMVGKVGAVFSCGGGHGSQGAGCEVMQLGILAAMAGNGMVIVPLPKCTPGFDDAGSHWGPHGRAGGPKMQDLDLAPGMVEAARHHGANVARVAAALRGRELFARGNVAPVPEMREPLFQDARRRAASVGAEAGL